MRTILALLFLSSICFAQELKRPLTEADGGNNLSIGCVGQNIASVAMPLGYDSAGISTNSALNTAGSTVGRFATRTFKGIPKATLAYSALTLNVFASSNGWRAGAGLPGDSVVAYSLDNGASWTVLKSDGSGPSGGNGYSGLFTATLATTQDLTKIIVGVCTAGTGTSHGFGSDDIELADIYTLGTTTAQTGGTGSTKGQAHRGAVVVN